MPSNLTASMNAPEEGTGASTTSAAVERKVAGDSMHI